MTGWTVKIERRGVWSGVAMYAKESKAVEALESQGFVLDPSTVKEGYPCARIWAKEAFVTPDGTAIVTQASIWDEEIYG